jgi:hypothetical protein
MNPMKNLLKSFSVMLTVSSKMKFELLNFLIENQIDVTLITETHFTANPNIFFPVSIFTKPITLMKRLMLVPQF